MKHFTILAVLIGLALFINSLIKDPQPQSGSPGQQAQNTKTTVAGVWPYLKDSGNPPISDDLLITNVYVVLDGSGSMAESGCSGGKKKITAAKRALTDFSQTVPLDVNLGVYVFDNSGRDERAPLAHGTHDAFIQAVNNVRAGGGTPLETAIQGAYQKLTHQAQSQLGYGAYHLVVVTDGEADMGESPRKVVNKILANSPVIVHTIGFCINSSHSLNQAGEVLYHTANDYAGLKAGLDSVLAESDQFTVVNF